LAEDNGVEHFLLGKSQVVERRVLLNGFVLLTNKKPDFEGLVCMDLGVNFGTRDEADEHLGAAHLIEHGAFKGNLNISAREIIMSIERRGGKLNAYTDIESTDYCLGVTSAEVNKALKGLYDIAIMPDFGPVKVEKEKRLILQEMAIDAHIYEQVLDGMFWKTLYPNHPAGRPKAGTKLTIEALTRDILREYHQKYYVAQNMAMAIVGDFDDSCIDEAIRLFERVSPGEKNRRVLYPATPQVATIADPHYIQDHDFHQFSIGAKLNDGREEMNTLHPDIYTVDMINLLLGESERMSSRVNEQAREKRALSYDVESDYFPGEDYACYNVSFSREGNPDELLRIIYDEIASIATRPITEEEFISINGFAIRQYYEMLTQIDSMATSLISYELIQGGIANWAVFPDRVTAVTPEKIIEVASRWMNLDKLSVTSVVSRPE
jgi:predicted Zn-dependent peptidase